MTFCNYEHLKVNFKEIIIIIMMTAIITIIRRTEFPNKCQSQHNKGKTLRNLLDTRDRLEVFQNDKASGNSNIFQV